MPSLTIRIALACAALSFAEASVFAQAAAPAASAEQLKNWVGIRQSRVDLLRDEIKQIDSRIESRLDLIVDALQKIGDSKDSRTKVARMKEDTMKGLYKTIEYYANKRASLQEDLRNPRTALTEAEKRQIIAKFDARIEKRTQQILALQRSMPSSKDYDRYTATGGGWWGTEYQRNEDYDQNRRMTSHSNMQRDAIVKQLDQSIARLDRQGKNLKAQAAAAKDPAQKKAFETEAAKNDALVYERRQQRIQVLQPPAAALRNVDGKEAQDLDTAIKKSVTELRADFNTLFQRYNTLITEASLLNNTKTALAKAK